VTITITNGSWDFKAQQGSVEVWEGNYTLYDLGRVNTIPPPIIIVPPPTPRPHITCQYIYDTNIGYLYEDTKMWYFPISMRSLIDREMVSNVVSYAWLYYSINLKSGTTTINKHPFYVYKKCKEDKWSKWQLFWLNPHGGFDTFTFDRKMESNYKIDRTTYKQRTPVGSSTSFDSYFGGEKIFNTDSVEEITLRSNLLTQMESQLLIQLCQSPVVYLMKEYRGMGLGRELFNRAFTFAVHRGYKKIQIEVSEKHERAIRFYERAGFMKVERKAVCSRCEFIFEKEIGSAKVVEGIAR
jgi:GNAT superfamily N-acetyltransferase